MLQETEDDTETNRIIETRRCGMGAYSKALHRQKHTEERRQRKLRQIRRRTSVIKYDMIM